MLAVFRFTARNLALRVISSSKPELLARAASGRVTLQPQPFKPPPKMTHDEFNMKIGRPQSPHLTIYAVELPSTLSITHRMMGTVLGGYTVLLSASALILPDKFSHYIDLLEALNIGAVPIFILKFILCFPFCYHMCNGIRHLVWDLGHFLTIKEVYLTGYVMLACAFSSAFTLTLM